MMPKRRSAAKAPTRCALRLPLPLAARLAAWCEMHPQRRRSEVIAELIEAGLAQAERAWAGGSALVGGADLAQPIYLPTGPFDGFRELVRKHHLRLEHDLDGDEPAAQWPVIDYPIDEA